MVLYYRQAFSTQLIPYLSYNFFITLNNFTGSGAPKLYLGDPVASSGNSQTIEGHKNVILHRFFTVPGIPRVTLLNPRLRLFQCAVREEVPQYCDL